MTAKNRDIEIKNYAYSLVAHGFYKSIKSAMKESKRFFDKCDNGLTEPMKCPHRLGITIITETVDNKIKSTTHIL